MTKSLTLTIYNKFGDAMKVYVDFIIFINFVYDFMILASVSILLKRNTSTKKILIGCLIGSSTLCSLFISLSSTTLFLLKLITSLAMVVFTFGGYHVIENIFYFYIITIIIGGFQYMFSGNEYQINLIMMLCLSPIIIGLYIYSQWRYKKSIHTRYDVIIIDGKRAYTLTGYMDTGNTLKDPITKYPILLVSNSISFYSDKVYYVPYRVVNNDAILKCIKVDKVLVANKEVKVLLGLVDNNIFKAGIDIILNECIREEITC